MCVVHKTVGAEKATTGGCSCLSYPKIKTILDCQPFFYACCCGCCDDEEVLAVALGVGPHVPRRSCWGRPGVGCHVFRRCCCCRGAHGWCRFASNCFRVSARKCSISSVSCCFWCRRVVLLAIPRTSRWANSCARCNRYVSLVRLRLLRRILAWRTPC